VGFDQLKLAAGAVILSPFLPLLFMGEEYGETAPFQYMVSHSDPALMEAVRKGRREEFATFNWKEEMPDPGAEATFNQCRLNSRVALNGGKNGLLKEFYRELLHIRKGSPAIRHSEKCHIRAIPFEAQEALAVFYDYLEPVCLLLNFSSHQTRIELDWPSGNWRKKIDSAEERWGGMGSALPETLHARGRVSLEIAPHSLAAFSAR
jgi:maltooligosyltrehalose trehalohydrolase